MYCSVFVLPITFPLLNLKSYLILENKRTYADVVDPKYVDTSVTNSNISIF